MDMWKREGAKDLRCVEERGYNGPEYKLGVEEVKWGVRER